MYRAPRSPSATCRVPNTEAHVAHNAAKFCNSKLHSILRLYTSYALYTPPGTDPTEFPSFDPSVQPTFLPTKFPSPEPTDRPTKSPIMSNSNCESQVEQDIVFLVDTSCYNGLNQCNQDQQEFNAEIVSSIVGPNNLARAAYIRYDSHSTYVDIALDDPIWDHHHDSGITQEDTVELYHRVRDLSYTNTGGYPDVDAALEAAYKQFDVVGQSDEHGRDKKIVMVTNSYLPESQQQDICAKHETKIRTGSDNPVRGGSHSGYTVIMVNMGAGYIWEELVDSSDEDDISTTSSSTTEHQHHHHHHHHTTSSTTNAPSMTTSTPSVTVATSEYIPCLVGYDSQHIFAASTVRMEPELSQLVGQVQAECCTDPTPAPTTNPTVDPTAVPTKIPTSIPTADPTALPSAEPTRIPTKLPTSMPTAIPTAWPTSNPSVEPTSYPTTIPTIHPTDLPSTDPTPAPTGWPTESPTTAPTPSPNMEACENGGKLDVVFLVDSSIELSEEECADRNEFTAELYTAVKVRVSLQMVF